MPRGLIGNSFLKLHRRSDLNQIAVKVIKPYYTLSPAVLHQPVNI